MDNWLQIVSNFLGCEISSLNPNIVYSVTVGFCAVFTYSFAYLLSRVGKK